MDYAEGLAVLEESNAWAAAHPGVRRAYQSDVAAEELPDKFYRVISKTLLEVNTLQDINNGIATWSVQQYPVSEESTTIYEMGIPRLFP